MPPIFRVAIHHFLGSLHIDFASKFFKLTAENWNARGCQRFEVFPPSLSFNLWECFYPVFPQWESRQGWETHTIERSHAWQQGSRNHYNFPKEAIGKKPRVSTGTWQIKFQAEEFSVTWVLVGDGLQVWAPVVNSWGDAKVRALDPTSVTQILRVVASCVSWTKDQP